MEDCTSIRLFDFLKDEYLTDVTFQVQDVEIKAHRLVLLAGGGVLGQLIEEHNAQAAESTIRIDAEITPGAFKMVLQFIYTDSCDVNNTNLFEVTNAAVIFKLDRLEKYCANIMQTKLAVSNIAAYASFAVELDAKENVRVCQEYFRSNTLQVMKMNKFLEISYNVLLALCSSDGITCPEIDLFLACVEWAKRECKRRRREVTPENQRVALGDVLTKIRFPVMKKEEFEDKVVPLEILTYEEVGRLIVGWRKMEHRTDFSDEYRTEIVQVTVTDHRALGHQNYNSCLTVPLSTRIKDLKDMKIFYRASRQSPAEKFTLAYKGMVLRNEETLASFYDPGEEFIIDIYSIDVTVKDAAGQWQFPLTIKTSDMNDANLERLIRGAVYSQAAIAIQTHQVDFKLLFNGKQYNLFVKNLIAGCVIEVRNRGN